MTNSLLAFLSSEIKVNNTHGYSAILIVAILCGQVTAGLHDDIDALFPAAQATHKAVKIDGKWEDPSTWSPPEVPPAEARVYLPCNTFTKLHSSTADLQWIRCEGVLTVCDHCDTQLNLHTLYIPHHGKFIWGMPDMPITANAVIEFVPGSACGLTGDYLPNDWAKDSLGILCLGEFMVCGSEKTAFLEIEDVAAVGATSIVPRDLSHEWMPGDRLLIAGTDSVHNEDPFSHVYQSEYRTISSIDSRTINFTQPLTYRHFPWRADLRYHVANLTRNVVIRSRDPSVIDHRGHLMFMSSMNDIRYARVEGLGRTDKSQPVTDPRKDANGVLVPGSDANPRRHYADHNHRCGPLNPPSRRMWVVYDSGGLMTWGAVNHDSNAEWDNCIAVGFAAGFVTEEGQERGAIRRCLGAMNVGTGRTIQSTDEDHGRASIGDWGTDGSAFWMHSGLVVMQDCVAFDNQGRGAAWFVRTLNGYPRWNYGLQQHLKYEIGHAMVDVPYLDQYVPLMTAAGYSKIPASAVPIKEFSGFTAYGNKLAVQCWGGPTHDGSGNQIWPTPVRSNVRDLKLWGRGGQLHLEYMPQFTADGVTIVGDSDWRGKYGINRSTPINMRSHHVTLRNLDITGFSNHRIYPAPVPIESVGDNGIDPDHVVDSEYPVNAVGYTRN